MFSLGRVLSVIAGLLLTGCFSLRAPGLVAQLSPEKPALEIARLLDAQARKCWQIRGHPLRSGITILSRRTLNDSFEIALHRVSEGMRPDPFMTVEVISSNRGTTVLVKEGDFSCSVISGCSKLGMAPQVEKWLGGNLECQENPVPFGG